MIKSKKSQIAVEYMWITGLLLLGVLFIFYYTSGETLIKTRLDAANDAVNAIASTANFIGVMEHGSKTRIWVKIPRGVVSTSVANSEALITMRSFNGQETDVFAKSDFELEGKIPDSAGIYNLNIEKSGDKVKIGLT
jgi:uncharacterized protein (UPF0333 family)